MFSASAELYDLICSRLRDYVAEAAGLAALIRQVHPDARTVLDVACGTAEHARHLPTGPNGRGLYVASRQPESAA